MTAYAWITLGRVHVVDPANSSTQGLGHVLHHHVGILVDNGIVLHGQEAMVVRLQDSHELEDGEGS